MQKPYMSIQTYSSLKLFTPFNFVSPSKISNLISGYLWLRKSRTALDLLV
ncbi:hypothetical protein MmTuc01_3257 [Methanosarcina mazei Tuc01]|uniref:Uncharacterized protein n=1 Tax=Methanosarcina mazei Tuc01 TaxID=1236903 RepID=M1QNC7_METMZ|nr:hypothetical protein MmTuc01_3257 [Methanosarcina mazei Tuc01]